MTDNEARRNPRLRLACARCQRRKIRCDGQFPKCSNCTKAATDCVDGDSVRLRNVPRDRTVIRLKSRVTWLESIIRERLPDVDLSAHDSPGAPELNQDEGESQVGGDGDVLPLQPSRLDEPVTDQPPPLQPVVPPDQRAHEIGLVSVGINSDQRYIGPSSGYFLARLVLACSPRAANGHDYAGRSSASMAQSTINELVNATQGTLSLPSQAVATQLCQVYFDIVHPQYPILHEPSFRTALNQLYTTVENGDPTQNDPYTSFQVYMVLAISSTIVSCRTKRHIPGESYCLSALQYFDRLNTETSLPGLQCIILLLLFTLHSPHMRLNVWYLNYQCLAAVLDLGLQRHVTTSLGISLLDQEMRTRVFWAVFTLDRTIATMMGRPIGLRDEACELRLPQNINDNDLVNVPNPLDNTNTSIAFSIHLFKLAKLTSEIKYVANSIVRDAPSYAYPAIPDVSVWQRGMLEQLDQWAASIPQSVPHHKYIRIVCKIRYHSNRMLLLRPSPAIPKPSSEMLVVCHESARQTIRLYDELYKQDLLVHDWITLHGIILSTITVLYCTRVVAEIAQKVELEELMSDMTVSLSILSATGEHWSSAKRTRDILEDLGKSTMRWIKTARTASPQTTSQGRTTPRGDAHWNAPFPFNVSEDSASLSRLIAGSNLDPSLVPTSPRPLAFTSAFPSNMQLEPGLASDTYQQQYASSEIVNLNDIVRNLFDGFIPQLDTYDALPGFYGA